MLYSKIEYSSTTKPLDEYIMLQVHTFLTENEEIIQAFDGDDVVAFFTNKKIIFVCLPSNPGGPKTRCKAELLPYRSISRCSVLGSSDTKHGKLKPAVSDNITLTFYIPKYSDAIDLCRKISEYI